MATRASAARSDLALPVLLTVISPMALKSRLESFAAKFADDLFAALRSASIHEIEGSALRRPPGQEPDVAAHASDTKRRRGSRARPSSRRGARVASTVDTVAKVLEEHPEGLRAEHIRQAVGGDARELRRQLRIGLETGAITKQGERRATVYSLGRGGPTAENA